MIAVVISLFIAVVMVYIVDKKFGGSDESNQG